MIRWMAVDCVLSISRDVDECVMTNQIVARIENTYTTKEINYEPFVRNRARNDANFRHS